MDINLFPITMDTSMKTMKRVMTTTTVPKMQTGVLNPLAVMLVRSGSVNAFKRVVTPLGQLLNLYGLT